VPPYYVGSVITFTLDLTGNGSLAASVDGNDTSGLFDNIMESLEGDEKGFVPCVSVPCEASVR
jgi:hypothetical protein